MGSLPLELHVSKNITFANALNQIVTKGFDVLFFGVSFVSGEIFTIGTDMYGHSWIRKPHIKVTCQTTCPDDWRLGDSFDHIGGSLVFFALEPFGVLALLAATLHPAPDLCVTSAIAIVALHRWIVAGLEDHIAIFVIGGKPLPLAPFSVELWDNNLGV